MTQSIIESSIVQAEGQLVRKTIMVLHVDDDLGFLKVSNQILENTGRFEVDTATSVEEAREKMEKHTYDIIVSDYQMPEKDGLQFLKELREAGNQIPFIIFTGKGREEVAINALNLGADQYLNKIGGPETVYTELEYAIRKTVKSKRSEETQESVQKRLENVFAASPDAITVTDLTGKIVDCNKATLELYGFSSKDKVIGRNAFEHIAESDRQRAVKNMKKVLEQDSVKNMEYTSLRRDGSTFTAELSSSIIRDSSGKPKGFVGITKDITERKKAAEALKESEKRFRTIFEGATDGILAVDPVKQRFVFANPRLCEITGYSLEELLKLGVSDIHPKEDLPYVTDQFTKQVEGKLTLTTDIPVLRKDKQVAYCDVNSKILEIGKQQYLVGFFRDITERKQTEEKLRKTKNYLSNLLDYANAPIIVWDNKKRITLFNNAFESFTGHKKESVLGRKVAVLFLPLQKEAIMQTIETATKGEKWKSVEIPILCKDKEIKIALWNSANITDKEGKTVATIAQGQDITKRKKGEQELVESEAKLKRIFNVLPDFVFFKDNDLKYVVANGALESFFGLKPGEVVGKTDSDFMPRDAALSCGETDRKTMQLGYVSAEETVNGRIYSTVKRKVTDETGTIVGIAGIIRDITEQKKAEESLKKTLVKLEKMNEKLEVVSSLVRHDLRNKFSTMLGRIYLAKKKLSKDHEALADLDEVQSAISESERILNFARVYEIMGIEELSYVTVSYSIQDAISLLPEAHSKLQGIKIVDETKELTVLSDSLLRQLFYNLIHNSIVHGEHVGKIIIRYKQNRDNLELIYEDDGVGILKAEKEKVFKEGYGKSTGFGLYLIKKMCEVYSWSIKETGKQGKGAQFTITMSKLNEQGKVTYKLN